MNKLILIGMLLVTRCSNAWWMTDTTPEAFQGIENIQFNELRDLPPEGCNDQWWEIDDLEVITWLEGNKKIIYVQEFCDDGTRYQYNIRVNF